MGLGFSDFVTILLTIMLINIQGPKPECEHLIMSLYLETGGLDIEISLSKSSKFCNNSEYIQFLKI